MMESKNKPSTELPDAQYRITLLMVMVLIMLPVSIFSYSIAVIAIIKGNYGVDNDMPQLVSQWIGLASAFAITVYLALHWYLLVRYYQKITYYLFHWRAVALLYTLVPINIAVFIFAVLFDLYRLPIYMIPFALICIIGYLIYLRHYVLSGKHLY